MERMVKVFVFTVVLMTLVIGFLDVHHGLAAAVKKPKNCFLLLYKDCFTYPFDFKPNEQTWSRSAVYIDLEKYSYFRYDIGTGDPWLKMGFWFRWQKSFYMHELCKTFVPPNACTEDPGLPVYGGSFSGTTGQGFMTKTTGTFEWPVCWYMKSITKGNYEYCPNAGTNTGSVAGEEEDEDEYEDQEQEVTEEAAIWFREMRDERLLEKLGPHE